jgi:hypothetical protein
MPEITQVTLVSLRTQLRDQLLRAAAALADPQWAAADALALTRNTVAAVLATVDTAETSPMLAAAWAASAPPPGHHQTTDRPGAGTRYQPLTEPSASSAARRRGGQRPRGRRAWLRHSPSMTW